MKLRTKKSWEKIGKFHHHGINIPLSAIWTKKSCGNGEFLDLIPLVDFLSEIKFDILQLLPLNDTGLDSSPYNAVSSIALHPIYISLHSLPYIPENLKAEIKSLQQLTYQKQLPYSDILNKKYKWLKEYLKKVGSFIKQEKNYQSFIQSNSWLTDYALFKIFKKKKQ